MADDGLKELDEGGEGSAAPTKKGGGASVLVGLFKMIAMVLGGVILVVVISFVVAKMVSGNNTNTSEVLNYSDEYRAKPEVLDWYSSIDEIRTSTHDDPPATVTVAVVFGYKKDDKVVSTEITQQRYKLIDFLRKYFTEKSMAELDSRNEDNLKIELRNAINDKILNNGKIRDVTFTKFDLLKP